MKYIGFGFFEKFGIGYNRKNFLITLSSLFNDKYFMLIWKMIGVLILFEILIQLFV